MTLANGPHVLEQENIAAVEGSLETSHLLEQVWLSILSAITFLMDLL